jgi:hypothetical protein
MLVATHIAVGASTRNGTARRAGHSPATARTVSAMAAVAEPPTVITRAAAQPAPRNPVHCVVHRISIGSGGCPFTCVG